LLSFGLFLSTAQSSAWTSTICWPNPWIKCAQ